MHDGERTIVKRCLRQHIVESECIIHLERVLRRRRGDDGDEPAVSAGAEANIPVSAPWLKSCIAAPQPPGVRRPTPAAALGLARRRLHQAQAPQPSARYTMVRTETMQVCSTLHLTFVPSFSGSRTHQDHQKGLPCPHREVVSIRSV